MREFELNVGLADNPYANRGLQTKSLLEYHIRQSNRRTILIDKVDFVDGEWEGVLEKTFAVTGLFEGDREDFINHVEGLCATFKQDAIAVIFSGEGIVVYNSTYTGERYPFDYKYFKSIKSHSNPNVIVGGLRNTGVGIMDGVIRKR